MKMSLKIAAAVAGAALMSALSVTPANAVTVFVPSKACSPKYVKTTSNAKYSATHTVGTGGGQYTATLQHGSAYTTKSLFWGIYSAPGPNYVDGIYLSSASISCY